jgi:hypothetical protein
LARPNRIYANFVAKNLPAHTLRTSLILLGNDRSPEWSNEIAALHALLNDGQRPDKTRYAGSTAFGGHRLQFRENESERKVEPACTGFAHDPYLTI